MQGVKAIILAGGLGTRLIEETQHRPKPMVEIGGMPILWHIMKIYSVHGITDFVICCGYKAEVIKEFFASYFLRRADVTFDIGANQIEVHDSRAERWKVTLIDTGERTQTGGRLRRVRRFVEKDPLFCFTYGDGLGNIDIGASIAFHRKQGVLSTLTAVQPPGRFGSLSVEKNRITAFQEKPPGDGAWINGGYFVLSPKVLDLIEGDDTIWERQPLERLAGDGQLAAYRHLSFWHAMDSLRDKALLNDLWDRGQAPWKIW